MTRRITSPGELAALREKARAELDLRAGPKQIQVTVHMGTCGIAAGAREVLSQLMTELSQAKATEVTLRQSGCAGLCDQEPMMTVTEKSGREIRYGKLDKNKIRRIVQEHILSGTPVMEYAIRT